MQLHGADEILNAFYQIKIAPLEISNRFVMQYLVSSYLNWRPCWDHGDGFKTDVESRKPINNCFVRHVLISTFKQQCLDSN